MGSDGVRLRPASRDDLPTVAGIAEAAYAKYLERIGRPPAPMYADYASSQAGGELYVLELDGQVVGVAEYRTEGGSIHVDNLAVHPEFQSQGIGTLFLREMEALGRAGGIHEISLYTNAAMHENLRGYAAVGFSVIRRVTVDGFDRVFMSKHIACPETFSGFFPADQRQAVQHLVDGVQAFDRVQLGWDLHGARVRITPGGRVPQPPWFCWMVVPGRRTPNGLTGLSLGLRQSEAGRESTSGFASWVHSLDGCTPFEGKVAGVDGGTLAWNTVLERNPLKLLHRAVEILASHGATQR